MRTSSSVPVPTLLASTALMTPSSVPRPTPTQVRTLFSPRLSTRRLTSKFRAAVDTPLLANMTEFGKTELLSAQQLEELGYNAVIWPVSTLRVAMGATEDFLRDLQETGIQTDWLERMQHRSRLYELVRYNEYNAFDQAVFTYSRTLTRPPSSKHLVRASKARPLRGVVKRRPSRTIFQVKENIMSENTQKSARAFTASSLMKPQSQGGPRDQLPDLPRIPSQELARYCSFEEVAYLLWNGELPNQGELVRFSAREKALRHIDRHLIDLITSMPKSCHPMDVLRTAISFIGSQDPEEQGLRGTSAAPLSS